MRSVVWFRGHDLRLSDHPPLHAASRGGEVIPVFVLDPVDFAPEHARERPHRTSFVLDSLRALSTELELRGSRLLVVSGSPEEVIPRVVDTGKAHRVVALRSALPAAREQERRLQAILGRRMEFFEGETLQPPGALRTGAGTPYSVFTHFARTFRRSFAIEMPLSAPRKLSPLPKGLAWAREGIPEAVALGLIPNPQILTGGERAARKRLRVFLQERAADYAANRDRMDLPGTSRLSVDLSCGCLSVRQVWAAVEKAISGTPAAQSFLNELLWREFNYSTLWDRPELLEQPFRPGFMGFPWQSDPQLWAAWCAGKTGYPVVDASARQLLGEGFVHNRARMISASFLTKHLLFDFRAGEAHYFKYLTDGDPAQNNAGWQWSAGCGCDAQPYFRIFNPVTQGQKFDPDGDYVRRWVPELSALPPRYVHCPWQAPELTLRAAGVRLGENYPMPVVEHQFARERYLVLASHHLRKPSRKKP